MKKISLSFLILITLSISSFANDENIDCKISQKMKQSYMNCENGIKGYVKPLQRINEVELKFNNNEGKEQTLTLDNVSNIQIINQQEKLKELLSQKGIKPSSEIKVSVVNLDKKSPLYKDPQFYVLSSGCHLASSPVVVSTANQKCDDYLCIGSVECKEDGKKIIKDAICKANIRNDGVTCPDGNACLADKFVSIEKYVPKNQSIRETSEPANGISR